MFSTSENILYFISGFGTLQGILLAILIYFHPKSDRSVNIFFALYIFSFSLIATTPLAYKLVSWQKSFFTEPLPFLIGPCLYLYVCSFRRVITLRKAVPHFIPFILFLFVSYWGLSVMGKRYPNAKEIPKEVLENPLAYLIGVLKFLQLALYYFLSRKALTSYQQSIQHLFSETSRINLNWMRWLINGFLVIIVASIIIVGLIYAYPSHLSLFLLIDVALFAPYIYIATYKGITQPTLWQPNANKKKQQIANEMVNALGAESQKSGNGKTEVRKPGLPLSKIDDIVAKIVSLMDDEKLYRETELTLQQLADKLQYQSYQVSQAINDGLKKNFYDLVNGYRVEEAKKLLIDPKNSNYTILSVGFEAGFNSKTTFNTVFKKFTGFTPTEFREKQKSNFVSA